MKRRRNYGIIFSAAITACLVLIWLDIKPHRLSWALLALIISQLQLIYFVIFYRLYRKTL